MMRFFRLALGAMAMLLVMLGAAALTVRLALHGGEVAVPNFAGLTVQEASDAALGEHLGLNIENKYYSTTVPAGRILSQAPAAGAQVRKDWQVRVTVSLGPQQVTIPDTVGLGLRDATMALRRDQLDLGTVGHLEAPGDPDMVLAQTPPPNAGVDQPRVNLLTSVPAEEQTAAFVMPSFVGMGFGTANHMAIGLGLKVAAIGGVAPQPPADLSGTTVGPDGVRVDANGVPVEAPPPALPQGPVQTQTPEAGHKAQRGDTIRLNFNRSSASGGAGPEGMGAPVYRAPVARPSGAAGASGAVRPAAVAPIKPMPPARPTPPSVAPIVRSVPSSAPPSAAPPVAGRTRTTSPEDATSSDAAPGEKPAHRNVFQKMFGLGKHKDADQTDAPAEPRQP